MWARSFYQFPRGREKSSLCFPHMHYRGKAMRYELVRPGGEREVLLNVPRYDFNWQRVFYPKEPIDAPKGSRLMMSAHFDNSAENPSNPDASSWVRSGEQTNDEMGIAFFDFRIGRGNRTRNRSIRRFYLTDVMRDNHPPDESYVLDFGRGALPAGAAVYLPRHGGDEGRFYLNMAFQSLPDGIARSHVGGGRAVFRPKMPMGPSLRIEGRRLKDKSVELEVIFPVESRDDPAVAFRRTDVLESERRARWPCGVIRVIGGQWSTLLNKPSMRKPVMRIRLMILALVAALPAGGRCDDSPDGPITFSRDIAPIFQDHCQKCHRPDQARADVATDL